MRDAVSDRAGYVGSISRRALCTTVIHRMRSVALRCLAVSCCDVRHRTSPHITVKDNSRWRNVRRMCHCNTPATVGLVQTIH